MAEYGKLLSRIWSDGNFAHLDARAQQMYCLLISYSTRNLAGVLPLTLKRWAKCTADADADNIIEALNVLSANNFILFDEDTEEVLIRTFIRNDEVYRQPNLMKAALRFAQQVESEALRWALHDELKRLPEPKVPDETLKVANALVEGLIRPCQKGLPEGLGEGLPEGSGVGVSYVGKGNTSTCNLQPAPTPAAEAPRSRGTRLAPDWMPPQSVIAAIKAECPRVDLEAEHRKFVDYWTDKAGRDATKISWDGTWRNWIRRAAESPFKAAVNGAPIATSDLRVAQTQALKKLPGLEIVQ